APRRVLPVEEASATLVPKSGTRTVAGRPTRAYAATSSLSMRMPGVPDAHMPSPRTEGEVWLGEGDGPAAAAMAAMLPLVLAEQEEKESKAQRRIDRTIQRTHGIDMEAVRRGRA